MALGPKVAYMPKTANECSLMLFNLHSSLKTQKSYLQVIIG